MLLLLTLRITPNLADGCVRAMSIAGDVEAPTSAFAGSTACTTRPRAGRPSRRPRAAPAASRSARRRAAFPGRPYCPVPMGPLAPRAARRAARWRRAPCLAPADGLRAPPHRSVLRSRRICRGGWNYSDSAQNIIGLASLGHITVIALNPSRSEKQNCPRKIRMRVLKAARCRRGRGYVRKAWPSCVNSRTTSLCSRLSKAHSKSGKATIRSVATSAPWRYGRSRGICSIPWRRTHGYQTAAGTSSRQTPIARRDSSARPTSSRADCPSNSSPTPCSLTTRPSAAP
jgi:hypothetical protein